MENSKLRELVFLQSTFSNKTGIHPKVHSKELDKLFGYKIPKIEEKLNQKYRSYFQREDDSSRKKHFQGTETWIGLHPQVLQTPYSDIFKCLNLLKDHDIHHIVDIGCAYGRIGLVVNSIFPNCKFTGYEILQKRQREGNRVFNSLSLDNSEIINCNVLDEDFILPEAQVYFIYDFSDDEDICKILDSLENNVLRYPFFLITKGERINFLIKKKYKVFWKNMKSLKSETLNIFNCSNL